MKTSSVILCLAMMGITSFANTHQAETTTLNSEEIQSSLNVPVDNFSEISEPSCTMGPNDDGFIPKGTITLTRVVSGRRDTFRLFNKRGVDYVATSNYGPFYRLQSRMTINGIEYKL